MLREAVLLELLRRAQENYEYEHKTNHIAAPAEAKRILLQPVPEILRHERSLAQQGISSQSAMSILEDTAELERIRNAVLGSIPWWEPLKAEWDGKVCGVCGAEKWMAHPFCRHCSIRCQRAGLMRTILPWCGVPATNERVIGHRWAAAYDRARDYLIVSRRERSESRD